MITQIRKIFSMISSATRRGLLGIFVLMISAAVLETLGISLFIPLLQFLTTENAFDRFPILVSLFRAFGVSDTEHLIIPFCIGLALFFIFKGISLGLIIYVQNRFITRHQALFAQELLGNYLNQPYAFHLQRNTMELVRNVTLLSVRVFVKGLLPLLQLAMEIMVITGIATVLVLIEPGATLIMGGLLGSAVALFYLFIRNRILKWGQHSVRLDAEVLVWINQALGSIKETKLYGHEPFFVRAFAQPNMERAGYLAKSITAPQLPRLFIEAIAIGTLSIMVAVLVSRTDTDVATILPTLGLFGIAAMRLMPSLSKIVSAITTFRENTAAIDTIYADYGQARSAHNQKANRPPTVPAAPADKIPFTTTLELKDLGFRFPKASENLFEKLNLTLEEGASIAFVGASGAGKSTLVDLILGLLDPSAGQICVDGKPIHDQIQDWQSLIGYIPQDIYILDDTLRRNVALGQDDDQIDEARLANALAKAQLTSVIQSLADGLDTRLGENGSRLSGGQRQRIGIARALYHEPQVLIMDEATSALDSETEQEITTAIQKLSGEKTILIIAHRLSTIRHCDKIVLMDQGRIVATGTFEQLESNCPPFQRLVQMASLEREVVH